MGRNPCCSKEGLNRGAWTAQEDTVLSDFIKAHGEGRWRSLPKRAGLKRCGKSCRLRWLNYLRPDIKRGNISPDEEELIIRLHKLLGNRWSLIAGRLPGRTDNEIKNYWNTNLGKRQQQNHPIDDNQRTKTPTYKTVSPSPSLSKPMNDAKLPPVVWTKALKCSKQVFPRNDRPDQLTPDQTPTETRDHLRHDPMMPNQADHSNTLSATLTNNSYESNFQLGVDDHAVLDFNIGDLCLTDLLDCTDFTMLSDNNHQPAGEIMLSGQHGIGLDMHQFASFVDYNGEDQWLG